MHNTVNAGSRIDPHDCVVRGEATRDGTGLVQGKVGNVFELNRLMPTWVMRIVSATAYTHLNLYQRQSMSCGGDGSRCVV